MNVSRSKGSAVRSGWKLLWVAVLACPVMACKSTGPVGPSEPGKGPVQCPAELLLPQTAATYTVNCEGFTPKNQRIVAGSQVTFESDCDHEVVLTFSNPSTLFTSGVQSIVLKDKGDKVVETVTDSGACHEMCFNSPTCPQSDDMDSKTGNLDVYTSGGPEPEPKK